jgi:hypothetical protein
MSLRRFAKSRFEPRNHNFSIVCRQRAVLSHRALVLAPTVAAVEHVAGGPQMSHDDLLTVAKRVIWFKTPEDALRDTKLFLAHVMTYGTLSDISLTLEHFSEDDFEAVLNDPPPGVFDIRSWTYWNVRYHREPVPPLPRRKIPDL